jgi:hypothetical protein
MEPGDHYRYKYLKYRSKYLRLVQLGGGLRFNITEVIDFYLSTIRIPPSDLDQKVMTDFDHVLDGDVMPLHRNNAGLLLSGEVAGPIREEQAVYFDLYGASDKSVQLVGSMVRKPEDPGTLVVSYWHKGQIKLSTKLLINLDRLVTFLINRYPGRYSVDDEN